MDGSIIRESDILAVTDSAKMDTGYMDQTAGIQMALQLYSGNSYWIFEALQQMQPPGGAIQSGGSCVHVVKAGRSNFGERRHHLPKMPSWRAHLVGFLTAPCRLFIEASPLHLRYIWTFRELQFASRAPKDSQKIVASRTACG